MDEKYKEALNRAWVIREDGYKNKDVQETVEYIFPQLKQEKNMKEFIQNELACIRVLEDKGSDRYNKLTEAIKWLDEEKKEELSTSLNGLMQEYVKYGKDEEEQEHRLKCYQLFWDALGDSDFFKQKEQKPEGVYVDCTEHPDWYGMPQKPTEKLSKEEYVKKFKAFCDAYEIKLPNHEYDIYGLCEDLHKLFGREPFTKEWSKEDKTHRDFILESLEGQIRFCKKDAEGAYYTKQIRTAQNWLKSLPLNLKKKNEDVAKLCSNEWSEEDEKMLMRLLDSISIGNNYKEMCNWLLSKLKSIHPQGSKDSLQTHWKPTEEQMKALNYAIIELDGGKKFEGLYALRNDLKKLMFYESLC